MSGPLSEANRRLQVVLNTIGDTLSATRVVEDMIDEILSETIAIFDGVPIPPALWSAGREAKEGAQQTANRLLRMSAEVATVAARIRKAGEN